MRNFFKNKLFLLFSLSCFFSTYAQNENYIKDSVSNFKEYYPISVKPSLGYLSSISEFEADILFEARPIVYYSIVNNIRDKMLTKNCRHKPSDAIYVSFQPHIRMYTENSLPVKTPSYRASVGWQRLIKTPRNDFFSYLIESGHFSNGQSNCAFSSEFEDESQKCFDVYKTIDDSTNLSKILNRESGNFSTNFTRVALNFRANNLSRNNKPYMVNSFGAFWEHYHNRIFGIIDRGGYTDEDIAIYGRNIVGIDYEFIHTYNSSFRWSIGFNTEYIIGAHVWVEPLRFEIVGNIYPFDKDLGFFIKYINGHDNYNYRFVDSGSQISFGINWDWFTPFEIERADMIRDEK